MNARLIRRPTGPRKEVAVSKGEPPGSLPARLFVLSCESTSGRLKGRSHLGQLLRAAALVDLQLTGHLIDEEGGAASCCRRRRTRCGPPGWSPGSTCATRPS